MSVKDTVMGVLNKLNPLTWLEGAKTVIANKYLRAMIRWALTAGSAGAVALGVWLKAQGIDPAAVDTFVGQLQELLASAEAILTSTGALLLMAAWSLIDKKKNQE